MQAPCLQTPAGRPLALPQIRCSGSKRTCWASSLPNSPTGRCWRSTTHMPHTRPTLHMPQAATESTANEITVEFDAGTQSLDALQAAAYRLIGTATCRIDRSEGRFICHLAPIPGPSNPKKLDTEPTKSRFLDLVTDENVRERLAIKTEPIRNLILSLAFGSLTLPPTTKD